MVPQVFPSNWWGFIYKRLHPSIKLVWICHEPSAFIHSMEWIGGLKPFWKRALAYTMKPFLAPLDVFLSHYSDAIVANSHFTANLVVETYGREVDAVAYPGIDYRLFSGADGTKQQTVITVAHLTRYKRVDFLLRVFARIKKDYPDLTYHIVGDGDDMDNLKALASDLGISNSVIFHGRLSHAKVAVLNSSALLFLHGSINETFGMAPLEAIACGTPVLAHRGGGPREFVTEHCGRLVDSLDANVWAQEAGKCLQFFYEGTDRHCGIKAQARNFDWSITLRPAVKMIALMAGSGK
ncbi:MAG: glycosyltransferase, partial [Pelovirga sp.]